MPQLNSLERGLRILGHVAEFGEASAESIATEVGIPVSSTYRYIRTLCDAGYIVEQAGVYLPGRQLLGLAGRHVTQSHLADIGTPVLKGIVSALGETAVIIVRVGRKAICLRRVEPDKSLKYSFTPGQLLPLHAGAGQRILLAWAPKSLVSELLGEAIKRFTPATLTAQQLVIALPHIRESGWVVSRGELDPGSLSVAVPVFLHGEVVCSLNVAGPAERCDSREWIARAVAVLTAAASDLSDSLETWARVPAAGKDTTHDDYS